MVHHLILHGQNLDVTINWNHIDALMEVALQPKIAVINKMKQMHDAKMGPSNYPHHHANHIMDALQISHFNAPMIIVPHH